MPLTVQTVRTAISRNTAAENTYAFSLSSNATAGATLVLVVTADNSASGGSSNNISGVTDTKGNTWSAIRQAPLFDNGTTNAGIQGGWFDTSQSVGTLTTSDTITVAFSGTTTVARAVVVYQITPESGFAVEYVTGGVGTGAAAANGQITTGTVQIGQVVFAAYHSENVNAVTGDSDTTNGSWATQETTTVGATTSGIRHSSQYKIQTTVASTQSYDVTVSSQDRIVSYVQYKQYALKTATANAVIKRTRPAWTLNTQGSPTFNDVAYGNGYWVTVGSASALYYATDPTGSWTSNTQGTLTTYGVAYGNGYWVTVGASGDVWYRASTPDGSWTENDQGTNSLYDVAYANGYWVAVGNTGTLYYTTGPTGSWTSNAQGSTSFNAVAYGNGYWVAVGYNGNLRYRASTPDGSWTSNTQGSTPLNAVAYGNGYWVAVGDSGALYYATDPTGSWTSNTQGTTALRSVTYANGYWVVVGYDGTLYYATNPTGSWTSNAQGTTDFNAVAYANGYWVASGYSGELWYAVESPSGGGFAASSLLRKTFSEAVSADAIRKATVTVLGVGGTTPGPPALNTIDAYITAGATTVTDETHTADAVIFRTQESTGSADAVILKTQTPTAYIALDAVISRTQTGSFAADAVIYREQTDTLTADAIIWREQSATLTADAVVMRTSAASLAADAVILRAMPSSLTADAILFASVSSSAPADAIRKRTFYFGSGPDPR